MLKKKSLTLRVINISIILIIIVVIWQYIEVRRVVLKNRELGPEPIGSILAMNVEESSGIISSNKRENFYWTHEDSGYYGINPRTTLHGFEIDELGTKNHQEVRLDGVTNLDWGDIAKDTKGNIILADTGNSLVRRNFVFYRFPEPEEGQEYVEKNDIDKIIFRFPQGKELNNEAVFYADDSIYVLIKEYGKTKMYRLPDDQINIGRINTINYIDEFKFMGESKLADYMDAVTGADISNTELTMAFNTYKGIYMFKRKEKNTNFFLGKIYYLPLKWDIRKYQYEAISFTKDNRNLILTTEQGDIYKVSVDDFKLIREEQPSEQLIEQPKKVGEDRLGFKDKIGHMIGTIQVFVMDIIFR